jgi:hypothetical protein
MKLRHAATATANAGTAAHQLGSTNASALAYNPTARQFDALCSHFNTQLLSAVANAVHGRMWKVS